VWGDLAAQYVQVNDEDIALASKINDAVWLPRLTDGAASENGLKGDPH
jgi:hypothetical protein